MRPTNTGDFTGANEHLIDKLEFAEATLPADKLIFGKNRRGVFDEQIQKIGHNFQYDRAKSKEFVRFYQKTFAFRK